MKVVVEVAGWAELHPLSQLAYSARLYCWQGKMMELEQYQQQLLGIFLPNLSSCSEREQLERERGREGLLGLGHTADGTAKQQIMLV